MSRSHDASAATGSRPRSQRYLFIDGLRGVAAMWVVFYHLWDNLEPSVSAWFPVVPGFVFGWGNLGVEVFFVLSGFVIAHSVRDGIHTWRYLGRFALRRSIRLDPALWLTIAAEITVILLTLRFFPAYSPELPSLPQVAANMVYLQRFLGIPDVVPVFWTLTYEVQFYFVLVLSLVLWRSWSHRFPKTYGQVRARLDVDTLAVGALLISSTYSVAIYVGLLPLPLRGLFVDRWYQFGAGIAVWLWLQGRMGMPMLAAYFGLLTAAVILGPSTIYTAASLTILVTAGALVAAGAADRFHDWLAGPFWQFLGRISYSLYLIHATVGWRFVSLVRDLLGPELGVVAGTFALAGGVGLSVLAAWLMYRLVEAPTMGLARRVELPDRRDAVPAPASGFAATAVPSA